jgi:hypothetical protein
VDVSGVGASQALRAVLYEVAFVVLPGAAAVIAIDGRERPILTTVALGWAFGYALEVGAFCATAAADERWIFRVYPVVVILAAAGWMWRRTGRPAGWIGIRRGTTPRPLGARTTTYLALGIGCSLALAYAALGAFPLLPLPGHISSVSYHADSLIDVAMTAETAHHWPATVPYISGLHINYHWLVYAHTGAMAQVTGLDPALIVFRLATPLMLLAAFHLGDRLTKASIARGPTAQHINGVVQAGCLNSTRENGRHPLTRAAPPATGSEDRQFLAFNASMSLGTTLWTSPTTPRSAIEKIGASLSLLMAMMFLAPFMPTMCCVAPEIPQAM